MLLKQYTQRIQFFVSLSFFFVLYSFQHNKKYLRFSLLFSLFNFFHFPDDFSLTFQCARFYLEFCYSSHFHAIELFFFLFYDHHQNENAFKKKCAFLIQFLWLYEMAKNRFFDRLFVQWWDVRCSKYRLDCRFNMFFYIAVLVELFMLF